jgi:hypothetical protein
VILAFALFVVLWLVMGEPADGLVPLLMAGIALIFGAFQQRVLRRALGDTGPWALATALGVGAAFGLAVALGLGEHPAFAGRVVESAEAGAAGGAIIGTVQWWVLKTRVPGAGWWVPASIVGWMTGAALGTLASYFDDGLDIMIGPVVAAAVAGPVLVALVRSRPDDASGPTRVAPSATADPTRVPGRAQ